VRVVEGSFKKISKLQFRCNGSAGDRWGQGGTDQTLQQGPDMMQYPVVSKRTSTRIPALCGYVI
jgi:hypothetical protein